MRALAAIVLLLLLAGCGPENIVLRDPVSHETVACQGGPGYAHDCAAHLEAAGFKPIASW